MPRGFRLLFIPILLSLLVPSQLTQAAHATPDAAPAPAAAPGDGGGLYVPLATQARLLDTGTTPLAANAVVTSTLTGRGGIPATGVAAVSVNIIAVAPTANGSIVSWPAGQTRPSVSGVLFAAGQAYSTGSSILPLNAAGQAAFANASTGTTRILVDVAGYYTTSDATTGGSRYVPLKQTRILDTRNKIGVPTNTAVPAKSSITFTAAGVGGLPAASAITSVAITLTALSPTAAGGMIIYPAGGTVPGVSHGNWPANRSKSSTVVTRIAADGKVTLANTSNGTVHFLAEVVGYYTSPTNSAPASSRFTTLPIATRVLDTGSTLIPAGGNRTFKLAGLGGLPASDLAAVSGNLIVAGTATSGDIVAYPAGETAPAATDAIALPTHYSFNQILVRPNAAGEITILNRSNAGARFYLDVSAYALKPQLPTAPTDVLATPANQSANLSWTAPADTGDLSLKNYEITRNPGNVVTTVTSTSTTITGLTNDTTYTFKVVAVNAVGRSTAVVSPPVTPTPPAPPGSPFISAVTARDSAAAVAWDAPAGMPEAITNYTVTATPGGATMTVPGTARDAVLKGLTNGTTYAITVKATNAIGSGTSDPRPVTPVLAKAPLAPSIGLVTALNERVDLQWVRPADGGAEVDNYQVTADPGGITQTIPAGTTVTALTGLTNGQKYTIKVRAHNKAGYGDIATTTSTPLAARAPGVPDNLQAIVSANGAVQLTWKAPIDNGTSAVTGYRVTVTPGGQVVDVTSPSATVTGLDKATAYSFAVAAKNATGTGAATVPSAAILPAVTEKVAPVVLTAQSLQQIVSLTPTAVVAAKPTSQLSGLQVGQIVVAGSSTAIPQGFLRQITKVQTVNGLLVLNTENAALSDVYDEMALTGQFRPRADDVARFTPAGPGIRLVEPTINGKTREQGATAKVLGDSEGKVYVQDNKIVVEVEKELQLGMRVSGTVAIDPDFSNMISVGPTGTAEFRLVADYDASFRYDMTLGKKTEVRLPLGEVTLGCKVFMVAGRVPVQVCFDAELELVGEADGRAGLSFNVSFKRRLGAVLKSGPIFGHVIPTGINEPLPDGFSFDHGQITGNAAASIGVAPKLVGSIYRQGGPEVEMTPYIEYEVDTAADPAAKAVFGVQIGGGLDFDFLRRKAVRWAKPDILKFETILWDSGGPFNGMVVDPGSAEIGPGGSQQFKARLIGFPDEPANWRIVSGPGTVDANGLYQATADGTAQIEATVPGVHHPEFKNTATVRVSGYLPSEPRNIKATAGIRTAEVGWEPPESSGQKPITHYMVSTSPASGVVKVPATDGNRVTLRNLTPDTKYVVNVTAVNADGVGKTGSSAEITPRTTTLSDPGGGGDLVDGIDGQESGIDGVVFSESGRYAFFATQRVDRQFYLIRRDLADRSYQNVSVGPDGTTPEPIATGFRMESSLTAPNYATAGEGRYIAYRTAAGATGDTSQIAVRDLETGERWVTPPTPNAVAKFRLSADGKKLTYITGNPFAANRRVYQATKGSPTPAWLDGCFDAKSCGAGSATSLGVSPDGNTVMYMFESQDPASPYYTATNKVMVLNVLTGEKTMPYLNKGLSFYEPVFSEDASWMVVGTQFGTPTDPQLALAARRVGTGPVTSADVVVRGQAVARDISNDGDRIAWRNYGGYPDPMRLSVYSRSTKTNWTAPGNPQPGYYQDEHIDLAPSGSAVTWHETGEDGHPFLTKPWGAALK